MLEHLRFLRQAGGPAELSGAGRPLRWDDRLRSPGRFRFAPPASELECRTTGCSCAPSRQVAGAWAPWPVGADHPRAWVQLAALLLRGGSGLGGSCGRSVDMVDEMVEQRPGEALGAEDVGPLVEGEFRGDQGSPAPGSEGRPGRSWCASGYGGTNPFPYALFAVHPRSGPIVVSIQVSSTNTGWSGSSPRLGACHRAHLRATAARASLALWLTASCVNSGIPA